MSILVTVARGAVARVAVARGLTTLLTARGIPHRLGSRAPDTPGTVHCDLGDPGTFPAALEGVRTVFLYAEASRIEDFVAEAVTAGVEHVVLLFAVLTDRAHAGRAYTLTGPQSLTFAAQLAVVGEVLGRPTAYEPVSAEEWKAEVDGRIPGPYADALLDFWAASADVSPAAVTGAVERLTGHPARTFEERVRDHAGAFAA
ncbi:hypothetical protein ACN6AT_23165 [Streptomyces sp. JL4002]|uniref:hypothetical protein n=1 Tax=Streptomyces sp. JL4002 TaxID=3404781 RepID=UPI003B28BD46